MFTQTFDVSFIIQRDFFLPTQSLDNLTVIQNTVCVRARMCACKISLIVVCEREGKVRISSPLQLCG